MCRCNLLLRRADQNSSISQINLTISFISSEEHSLGPSARCATYGWITISNHNFILRRLNNITKGKCLIKVMKAIFVKAGSFNIHFDVLYVLIFTLTAVMCLSISNANKKIVWNIFVHCARLRCLPITK